MEKTILNISKPSSNSFIIWEHLLKSSVAFVGTYLLLFFGPMFLFRKGSRESIASIIMDYFIEHPEVQIGLCVVAVAMYNIFIFMKNKKNKYIVKILIDEKHIQIELTNLYFSSLKSQTVLLTDLEFFIENSVTSDDLKNQKFVFENSKSNELIGEIDPNHFFWADHKIQLRSMIKELNNYASPPRKVNNRQPGVSTFWK